MNSYLDNGDTIEGQIIISTVDFIVIKSQKCLVLILKEANFPFRGEYYF